MRTLRSMRVLGRRLLPAALAVAALATAPAAYAGQPQVVGGTAVTRPYPFMADVTVDYPGDVTGQCGGSLVAARYVVTAGHCVATDESGTPQRVDVTLGGVDLLTGVTPETRFEGATIVANPGFSTGGGLSGSGAPSSDVAVLRLPRPAPFAQIRLARSDDAALWAPGAPALALGYGVTESGDASAQLRQVPLPIADDSACQGVYRGGFDATDLCAGGIAGQDTCQGDSGGPLLVGDGLGGLVLAGVTSYGAECGSTYGVYTEVGGTVNAFLRSVVPQVEVDAPASGTPRAGGTQTFAAQPHDPDGGGPFGGYDALAWDLDGDGAFDDAVNRTTVSRRLVEGPNAVSVRATDAAGNAEVRTVAVVAAERDDGARVRTSRPGRVRAGRFSLPLRVNRRGTVRMRLRTGRHTVAARTAHVRPSTPRLRLRLTRYGRRALGRRHHGRLGVRLSATLTPANGGVRRTTRRRTYLR